MTASNQRLFCYVPGDETMQLHMIDGTIPTREVIFGYLEKRLELMKLVKIRLIC